MQRKKKPPPNPQFGPPTNKNRQKAKKRKILTKKMGKKKGLVLKETFKCQELEGEFGDQIPSYGEGGESVSA